MGLFNDWPPNKKHTRKAPKLQYGSAEKARATLKRLRKLPKSKQMFYARSMYYRAKYNKNQTKGMREAMHIYAKFLEK
jgi:hypothetical protein